MDCEYANLSIAKSSEVIIHQLTSIEELWDIRSLIERLEEEI
jgi:hypothetical protein